MISECKCDEKNTEDKSGKCNGDTGQCPCKSGFLGRDCGSIGTSVDTIHTTRTITYLPRFYQSLPQIVLVKLKILKTCETIVNKMANVFAKMGSVA